MSSRTVLRPNLVMTANMATASTTSTPTLLQGLSKVNYAVTWSGSTPVGTLNLQFSDDYQLDPDGRTVINAGTWNTVPVGVNGSPVTDISISGNTGNGMIDVTQTGVYAARLLYTAGSGTGTLSAIVTGKVS